MRRRAFLKTAAAVVGVAMAARVLLEPEPAAEPEHQYEWKWAHASAVWTDQESELNHSSYSLHCFVNEATAIQGEPSGFPQEKIANA